MVKKSFIRAIIFLLPVAIIFAVVELKVRALPSSPAAIGDYLQSKASDIEVIVLGASQNQAAINPEYMDIPTVNLSSGHQDYASDNALLQQLHPKLPKLQTVIIAMTFAHFDSPTNGDQYWKNAAYLYHYDVNMFNRNTQFYDEFLFISNPSFYSDALLKDWQGTSLPNYNRYGHIDTDAVSAFAKAQYNPQKIAQIPLSINNAENPREVIKNTKALNNLLDYCQDKGLKVLIILPPVTDKHFSSRNPEMVARRDSILHQVLEKRSNVSLYDTEKSNYTLDEFTNHNHLNSKGAERYTKKVSAIIKQLP